MCLYDAICINVYFLGCVLILAVWFSFARGELLVRRQIDEGRRGLTNDT